MINLSVMRTLLVDVYPNVSPLAYSKEPGPISVIVPATPVAQLSGVRVRVQSEECPNVEVESS